MATVAPFTPYQNPLYQAPTPWANSNTYAPWSEPNGQTGDNPSFSGTGQESHIDPWKSNDLGSLLSMQGSFFGLGRKRASPNFYAPSYQGNLFTPQEGLPQWYGTSQEGQASDNNAMQMNMQMNSANSGANAPMTTNANNNASAANGLGYGFDTMPSYIGQAPYLGNTVNNYSPSVGGSYGGYDTYGGYGNSQNKQTSQYQPYVPTGYGQY